MQPPQFLGIILGICSIIFGVLAKRYFVKFDRKTLAGTIFVTAVFIGIASIIQNLIYSYVPTWSWHGVVMIWADFLGTAIASILFGCLGLLCKPNRVAGYTVALIIAIFLIRQGNM